MLQSRCGSTGAGREAQRQQLGEESGFDRSSYGVREGAFRALAQALEYVRPSDVVQVFLGVVVRRRLTQ